MNATYIRQGKMRKKQLIFLALRILMGLSIGRFNTFLFYLVQK